MKVKALTFDNGGTILDWHSVKTAFVRRPVEWGPEGPPDPAPHPDCDLVVDGFEALADKLGL